MMGLQNGAEKNHTDGTDEELEDEDEDGGGIDEDSLMWDAQVCHFPPYISLSDFSVSI